MGGFAIIVPRRTDLPLTPHLSLVVFLHPNGSVDLRMRYAKGDDKRWLTPVLPLPVQELFDFRSRRPDTAVSLEHEKMAGTLVLTLKSGYLLIGWQEAEHRILMQSFYDAIRLPERPAAPVVAEVKAAPVKRWDPDGSEFWSGPD